MTGGGGGSWGVFSNVDVSRAKYALFGKSTRLRLPGYASELNIWMVKKRLRRVNKRAAQQLYLGQLQYDGTECGRTTRGVSSTLLFRPAYSGSLMFFAQSFCHTAVLSTAHRVVLPHATSRRFSWSSFFQGLSQSALRLRRAGL